MYTLHEKLPKCSRQEGHLCHRWIIELTIRRAGVAATVDKSPQQDTFPLSSTNLILRSPDAVRSLVGLTCVSPVGESFGSESWVTCLTENSEV